MCAFVITEQKQRKSRDGKSGRYPQIGKVRVHESEILI